MARSRPEFWPAIATAKQLNLKSVAMQARRNSSAVRPRQTLTFEVVCVYLLFFSHLFITEITAADDSPLFVSLGANCEVAVKIRESGYRNLAFPFDWLITTHGGLFRALEDDFRTFYDPSFFIQAPDHPWILEHIGYHIEFRHDWPFHPDLRNDPERYKMQLTSIVSKYTRRIARFRNLRSYKKYVVFIRSCQDFSREGPNYWMNETDEVITVDQALEIEQALLRYFPDLDFILAIVNIRHKISPPDGISKRLQFFQLDLISRDYTSIFKKLFH